LFPAIPKRWCEEGCSFRGFYLNKDIIVGASLTNNKIECTIENKGEAQELPIFALGEFKSFFVKNGENKITFKMECK
jgi:hypothetical protein